MAHIPSQTSCSWGLSTDQIWWSWLFSSVTLKVGQGGPNTIPSRFSIRVAIQKICEPRSSFRAIAVTSCFWWIMNSQTWTLWYWKWVKVTHIHSQPCFPWEVPTHQIWWSQLKSLTSYHGDVFLWCIHKLDLCDLESGWRWPHTIPSSFNTRGTYTPYLVIPAYPLRKLLW